MNKNILNDSRGNLCVCYFGTYRAKYNRNQILIAGLQQNGVAVLECHEKLWESVEDRVSTASGGWLHPKFWWRVLKTYANLLKRYRKVGDYDVLLVGYPGHFDIFLAWILATIRKKPLAWDVFNSLYLITSERGITERSPITVALIRQIERKACMLPDMLFLDTDEFVTWFGEIHKIPTDRFRLIPMGVDDRFFSPLENKTCDQTFRVIYYGTYIPNHGVEYIVEAAEKLKEDPSIKIEMIGIGPELEKAKTLSTKLNLENISFIGWMEPKELAEHIAKSDIVLGAFGKTKQLELTNNQKIYEGFAMMKPVISGSSPAMPKALKHGVHLYLCERGNPQSLADSILRLKAEPELRQTLVNNGKEIVHQYFDTRHIGQRAKENLLELVQQYKSSHA